MHCSDIDIWRGWADLVALTPSLGELPGWIVPSAHPKCSDPVKVWASLLSSSQDRYCLIDRSLTPSEITQTPLTTSEQAVWSIEARAKVAAASLAYGD